MKRTLQRIAELAAVAALACRTVHADGGPYLLNNPPLPTSADINAITMLLLVFWIAAMVSLGTVENRDDPSGRAGKPH